MMYLNFVQFGYFLFFSLLKLSAGCTIAAETGSTVQFSTDNWHLEGTCKEDIEVYFLRITGETKQAKLLLALNAAKNGYCQVDIVAEFRQRIYVSKTGGRTNLTTSLDLSIHLQYVSFHDTGKYYVTRTRSVIGECILFVSGRRVHTHVGDKMELDLVLSSSAYQESVLIGFYSGHMEPVGILLNPSLSHYVVINERWFVRNIGNQISIILESVQVLDQGIYFLEGRRTGNIYDSVISNVIAMENPEKDTGAARNEYETKENYFIGGGAAAGIVLVALISIFIYKCCHRIRMKPQGNAAGGVANEHDNIHDYSSIRNQDQCVSDSISTTGGYVPISEGLIGVTHEIEIRDGSRCDNIIKKSATNRSIINYITPY